MQLRRRGRRIVGPRLWPLLLVALQSAALSSPPDAAAQEPTRLRIGYDAPLGCPDRRIFLDQLTARTKRVRVAATTEAVPRWYVSLRRVEQRYVGALSVPNPDGTLAVREVPGASCDDVVASLALVTALLIDPQAITSPLSRPAAPRPPTPPPPCPPAAPKPKPCLKSPSPFAFGAGVEAAGAQGIAPDQLALAVGGYAEFLHRWESRELSSSVRIAVLHAATGTIERQEGAGAISATYARVDGCPFRWMPTDQVGLAPCAAFQAGILRVRGVATPDPETQTRPWMAPGLALHADWQPFVPMVLGAQAGVVFPLVRDKFFFRPDTPFHETPSMVGWFGLFLGMRFW